MGFFRDSPEEKNLRESVNNVASFVGGFCQGRFNANDLDEVWQSQRPHLQGLYDSVASEHGPRAPRKILAASYDIASISGGPAGGPAREVMHELLLTLGRDL